MPSARPAPLAVDFDAATSLALPLDFGTAQPQHFGAPPATSTALQVGSFQGAVARGARAGNKTVDPIKVIRRMFFIRVALFKVAGS